MKKTIEKLKNPTSIVELLEKAIAGNPLGNCAEWLGVTLAEQSLFNFR